MVTTIYLACALAHLALLAWGIRLFHRRPGIAMACALLPIAFVPYDNIVIALGALIGWGATLQALSWPRFLAHALVAPLWLIASHAFAAQAGVRWLDTRRARLLFSGLALVLVLIGLREEVVQLELAPLQYADVILYRNAGRSGAPTAPRLLVLVMVALGAAIWWRTGWIWLVAGAVGLLAAAALLGPWLGPLVVNVGEVLLASALLATAWRFPGRSSHQPAARLRATSAQPGAET